MGRRALRKIDPGTDLARHLKTFEDLPDPWDPLPLFGRTAPLEVEVGSGKGLFLRTAAAARPDANFLGIEIAHRYATFAAAGLARLGLDNAVMVGGDAMRVFRERLPAAALAAVHVYFPDPWWKKRHKKRRIICEPFLKEVERTLAPGGSFHFWTDVEEYFTSGLELIAAHAQLAGPFEVAEPAAAHEMDYRTHFERRTRLHGETVYRAEFRRAAAS